MKNSVTFLFLLLLAGSLNAQDLLTASLRWQVDQLTDQTTGQVMTYSCVFESDGTNPILWKQKNGSYVTTLTVVSITGTWADVSTPGAVTYAIEAEGDPGSLTFERNTQGTFITLTINAGGTTIQHQYRVSNIQQN